MWLGVGDPGCKVEDLGGADCGPDSPFELMLLETCARHCVQKFAVDHGCTETPNDCKPTWTLRGYDHSVTCERRCDWCQPDAEDEASDSDLDDDATLDELVGKIERERAAREDAANSSLCGGSARACSPLPQSRQPQGGRSPRLDAGQPPPRGPNAPHLQYQALWPRRQAAPPASQKPSPAGWGSVRCRRSR